MPSSAVQKCALRSEEHTSELQSHDNLVCRLLLEQKHVGLAGALVHVYEVLARVVPEPPLVVLPPDEVAQPRGPHPLVFFFNDTAATEIYLLSLHGALPI